MQTSRIPGSGVTLAVHDFGGNADGDAVLIAHATGFHGRAYRAFAELLLDSQRVVAVDLRAHGESTAPRSTSDLTWEKMAEDVATVVDWIDAPVVHAFGHSMGGGAILEAERQAPGIFSSAFLFEPIVPPEGGIGENELQRRALIRRASFASRAEVLQRYSARPPLGVLRADALHDYVVHGFATLDDGTVSLRCTPENEAATFAMAGTFHLGLLPKIALRTVVAKSGDREAPAMLANVVADALPNASLLEFPDLGHFGPLQEPVSVAGALLIQIRSESDGR